ncbi:MAG: Spo0E family sporulation regulatory protein-aspartic acid phosphatase [Bacillota bacterium]
MPKLKRLKKTIAKKRRLLQQLVDVLGTAHPAVIAVSAELDQDLNLYYRVRMLTKRSK